MQAERSVAVHQDHPCVGPRQLRSHRISRSNTQRSQGARIHPEARPSHLEHVGRRRHEVTAIANHHGVVVDKAIELGATVISLSDSKGSIITTSEGGITPEDIAYIAQLKVDRKQLTELTNSESHKEKFKYIEGARPWTHCGKVDVALDPLQIFYPGGYVLVLEEVGTPLLAVSGVSLQVDTGVEKPQMWIAWSGLALLVLGVGVLLYDAIKRARRPR